MKWYRLDYQWGSAGEYWYLQGGVSNAATSEFETLCTIAGDLLVTLPPTAVAPEALAETKAKYRWYLALWHHLTDKVPEHMGFESGHSEGSIFAGTVKEPVHKSAILCLQFSTVGEALSPLPPSSAVARLNGWIAHEIKERGAFWGLLGFLITVAVALLAL